MKSTPTILISGSTAVALAAVVICAGLVPGRNAAQAEYPDVTVQRELQDVAPTDPATGAKVYVDSEAQVVKDLGETGKLTVDGQKKPSFGISVNAVQVQDSCTLRGGTRKITPENGYFLVVDAEAWLAASAADYVQQEIALMPLDTSAFGVSAGINQPVTYGLNSMAAYSCAVTDAMDIAVGAGDRISGKIILDSPHRSGQIVYDPDRTGGWTWKY